MLLNFERAHARCVKVIFYHFTKTEIHSLDVYMKCYQNMRPDLGKPFGH